jgi:hypothetical protein
VSRTTVTFFDCDAPDCNATVRDDSDEADTWWDFSAATSRWGDEDNATIEFDGHACCDDHLGSAIGAAATRAVGEDALGGSS